MPASAAYRRLIHLHGLDPHRGYTQHELDEAVAGSTIKKAPAPALVSLPVKPTVEPVKAKEEKPKVAEPKPVAPTPKPEEKPAAKSEEKKPADEKKPDVPKVVAPPKKDDEPKPVVVKPVDPAAKG
jgi:hypothetical protein